MLKFLKYTLATFVGAVSAVAFLVLVLVIVFAVALGGSDKSVKDNSILIVKFDGEILDNASNSPLSNISFLSGGTQPTLGLIDILQAIEKAKTDTKIKGILLQVDDINAGISTVLEIRNALADFKESGKFVVSYSDFHSQKAYYLSSVADRVYLNPEGMILLKGLSINTMYFKNTFEKIGINPQIIRHGKYKSAIEILSEVEMSDASRYQLQEMIDDIWNQIKADICVSRSLNEADVNKIADELSLRSANLAKEYGFIDDVKYFDEIISECKDSLGVLDKEDISAVKLSDYIENMALEQDMLVYDNSSEIAVIIAQGDILPGEGSNESIGSDKIARMIRKARRDENVKAIVLRINSGGGSALASEVIWRESKLAADQKTFVISMGDAAASGGYYIACPADFIVANPTTITGSIGVFGVFFSGAELLDKLGVSTDVVKSNKNADLGSFDRPMNDSEIAAFRFGIESIYSSFIKHVAEGRNKTVAEIDSIGQGRVWTGVDALQIGLVDTLGGLKTAIAKAAQLENLSDSVFRVKYYPEKLDVFSAIMKDLGQEASIKYLKTTLGTQFVYYKAFVESSTREGIMTRLPFDMTVK